MAGFRPFSRLARLVLKDRGQGQVFKRSKTMARFETFGFTLGLLITGLVTFVALPLA